MGKIKISLLLLLFLFLTQTLNLAENNYLMQGTDYLAFAEKMPEPVGGLKAIYEKIEYPEIAKRAGVQGKVYVLAFINENGGVDEVKVIKGIGGGCDEAAVDAVKSSKFSPGVSEGKPARVKMSLQIQFKLG